MFKGIKTKAVFEPSCMVVALSSIWDEYHQMQPNGSAFITAISPDGEFSLTRNV